MMDFPWMPLLVTGFVVGLDTTAAFQIMVSQPLVACSLLGWMMGDPVMGAMVGVVTQLLWMGKMPVGAATFPDGNLGSLVAAALVIQFRDSTALDGVGILLALAVLWGSVTATVGGWLIVIKRKIHTRWVPWFERQAREGKLRRYSLGYYLVVGWNGIVGAAAAVAFSAAGYGILQGIIPLLPDRIHRIGFAVPYLLLGIGLTQVLILFRLQRWMLMVCGLIAGLILWRVM
jgi:PTS system mannose-specific IIC component